MNPPVVYVGHVMYKSDSLLTRQMHLLTELLREFSYTTKCVHIKYHLAMSVRFSPLHRVAALF